MPEEITKIAHISSCLANNPTDFFGYLDCVTTHAKSQSAPFCQASSQKLVPTISPEIIATVTAIVVATRNQCPIPATFAPTAPVASKPASRSKKLPYIPEYNGNIEKLCALEQLPIQRMHINYD